MFNTVRILFTLLFFATLCDGRTVFGKDYDQVWYVRFKFPEAAFKPAIVYGKGGKLSPHVQFVVSATHEDALNGIDVLFKDLKKFEDHGLVDDGLLLGGLVFFHEGKFVMAIIPNHIGYDLWTQPELELPPGFGILSLSSKQLAAYDAIVKDILYFAANDKQPKAMPAMIEVN